MDKLLESFYGLIPRSCEPLNCDDYRVANLVMVQIPEYLAIYYEINPTGATTESSSNASKQEIDPDERGPLSYLARYVVSPSSIKRVSKVRIRTIVFTAKHEIPRRTYSFISARTRGGNRRDCISTKIKRVRRNST